MNLKEVLLLTVTISIVYSCIDTPRNKEKDSKTITTSSWKSYSKDNYSFEYPKEWNLDTSGRMGSSFFILSPLEHKGDLFAENINLMIQNLPESSYTLDKFVEISENQVNTRAKNGKLILSKRIKEKDLEFHHFIYTSEHSIYKLKQEQYCWLLEDKAYILTFTAEEKEFQNYRNIGKKILDSFKILNK